jgi:hypothetical protein
MRSWCCRGDVTGLGLLKPLPCPLVQGNAEVTLIPLGDVIARMGTRRVYSSKKASSRAGVPFQDETGCTPTSPWSVFQGRCRGLQVQNCSTNNSVCLLGGQKREPAEYGHIRFDNTRFIPPSPSFVPHICDTLKTTPTPFVSDRQTAKRVARAAVPQGPLHEPRLVQGQWKASAGPVQVQPPHAPWLDPLGCIPFHCGSLALHRDPS